MSGLVLLVAMSLQAGSAPPYPATRTIVVESETIVVYKEHDATAGDGPLVHSWRDRDGVEHFHPLVSYRGRRANGDPAFLCIEETDVWEMNPANIRIVESIYYSRF